MPTTTSAIQRDELARYLDELLQTARYRDYCPNGLQVEGRATVARIVTGVSANRALIEAAIDARADAILVHHGYFWRGEDQRLVGTRRARIARLLAADLNLFAFHLPLDAHPTLGNNARLAERLGWTCEGTAGEQGLIAVGRLATPHTLHALSESISQSLGRAPQVFGAPDRQIERVAWCTGGAQGHFDEAIALGVDAYLTGEVSEQHVHLALESGVAFLAAGHHATERFGIQALGAHLAAHFGLDHTFVDIMNPV